MVCAHLRAILSAAEDIEVVDEAYDGAAAVESAVRHQPDVVLMDLRMPGVDGLTAIRHIRALKRPPVVVALTTFDTGHHVTQALRAGAAGYLLKSTPPEDLVELVRVVASGHVVLSSAASGKLLATSGMSSAEHDDRLALIRELTERETQVMACLGEGLSNAQIAARLHLTEATIKGYVSRLLEKLGCANRSQAGFLARDAGL
ncbi:DNA-binding response regulator [Spongiactinospora rosea]|uniref:DNA-binding response regulator n=2 Tax=Spongiactinospora rosea TaxID=2248750 RepID=A0A366M426_9ACTN|nr:DNA-binding response regulator [Spongiactinospora rosea]